jgi:hypothetical protein
VAGGGWCRSGDREGRSQRGAPSIALLSLASEKQGCIRSRTRPFAPGVCARAWSGRAPAAGCRGVVPFFSFSKCVCGAQGVIVQEGEEGEREGGEGGTQFSLAARPRTFVNPTLPPLRAQLAPRGPVSRGLTMNGVVVGARAGGTGGFSGRSRAASGKAARRQKAARAGGRAARPLVLKASLPEEPAKKTTRQRA